jgi:VanZ family protein
MAMVFALSAWQTPPSLPGGTDKGVHWLLYCGLSAFVVRALTAADWRQLTWRRVVLAIVISAAYGASDEFHQRFVPGRTPDVMDLVADTLGAAAAAIALRVWSTMNRARRARVD